MRFCPCASASVNHARFLYERLNFKIALVFFPESAQIYKRHKAVREFRAVHGAQREFWDIMLYLFRKRTGLCLQARLQPIPYMNGFLNAF